MEATQIDEIMAVIDRIRETALAYKADTLRIDKLERMAKASWASFDSVAFCIDSSGDVSTLGYDKAEGVPNGYFASYREAVDSLQEAK